MIVDDGAEKKQDFIPAEALCWTKSIKIVGLKERKDRRKGEMHKQIVKDVVSEELKEENKGVMCKKLREKA